MAELIILSTVGCGHHSWGAIRKWSDRQITIGDKEWHLYTLNSQFLEVWPTSQKPIKMAETVPLAG
jgi:hypothetical protein